KTGLSRLRSVPWRTGARKRSRPGAAQHRRAQGRGRERLCLFPRAPAPWGSVERGAPRRLSPASPGGSEGQPDGVCGRGFGSRGRGSRRLSQDDQIAFASRRAVEMEKPKPSAARDIDTANDRRSLLRGLAAGGAALAGAGIAANAQPAVKGAAARGVGEGPAAVDFSDGRMETGLKVMQQMGWGTNEGIRAL